MRQNRESLKELKCYMRKHSVHAKERSKGGTKEVKRYTVNKSKMADVNPTISIIASTVNRLNSPIKDRDCQTGLKKKIQLYAV